MIVKGEKFSTGRVIATPEALVTMQEAGADAFELLVRHVSGDWGVVDPDDADANNAALKRGGRILSVYGVDDGHRIGVLTEADRSVTTFFVCSGSLPNY